MRVIATAGACAALLAGCLANAPVNQFRVPRPRSVSLQGVLPGTLRPADVVRIAAEHRLEIVAARARAEAAAAVPRVVGALPDPILTVSLDHVPVTMLGVDGSVAIQQDFPLSGILRHKVRSADAAARAADADVRTTVLDVEASALLAFFMLVEVERMSAVLDELAVLARQASAVGRARLAGAEGNASEVVRADLEVVRLEGELAALAAEKGAGEAMLLAALGLPRAAKLPPRELDVPPDEPPPTDELVDTALEARPELAAMRERIQKAKADVDVMQSMAKPMAMIRAGGAYTMETGFGVMLMGGITLPIWANKIAGGVAESRSMARMAEADLGAGYTMIEGEVGAARQTVVAARTRFLVARDKRVPLAKQAASLSIASYAGGSLPLVSALDALRALREARMDEVVAEVRLARGWTQLGRSVGRLDPLPRARKRS